MLHDGSSWQDADDDAISEEEAGRRADRAREAGSIAWHEIVSQMPDDLLVNFALLDVLTAMQRAVPLLEEHDGWRVSFNLTCAGLRDQLGLAAP